MLNLHYEYVVDQKCIANQKYDVLFAINYL